MRFLKHTWEIILATSSSCEDFWGEEQCFNTSVWGGTRQKQKGISIGGKKSLSTFFTDRFWVDLESKSGLKECEAEYLVIPQASSPPLLLLARLACKVPSLTSLPSPDHSDAQWDSPCKTPAVPGSPSRWCSSLSGRAPPWTSPCPTSAGRRTLQVGDWGSSLSAESRLAWRSPVSRPLFSALARILTQPWKTEVGTWGEN